MRTEKFNLCKSTKKLLTLITLLTLGVGQMGAASSVTGGYIYFDVSQSGWGSPSSVEYIISHDSYSCWYAMSNISNTKLYYISSGSWGDAKYIAFTGNYGWTSCEANSYDSRKGYGPSGSKRTAKSTYGVNSGSTYLFYASSSAADASITTSSPAGYLSGGYGDLNSTQTINTVVKTGSGSYTAANSKATISITSYAMTGNGAVTKQTTSLGTSVKTQTVSAARTATTTYTVGDVASGYQFDGWYTAATGGTLLSASKTYTYYPTAATTVYARFSEKMSTVTLSASPSGKGSFTIGGAAATSTTAGVTTTRSVTAVPISGYHFVSWAITGGASISSTTTNPTTVTGGGAGTAATLTATFAADDVYSLTVAAGTGISAVTGSTNDIKAAQNIAITATVATGYTWNTWTKTGAGTLSTFTAGTKNQTITVGTAGDITLTASATETMRTITINGGTAASTTAGVATTGSATAAAPAAGKKFTGWTLGSGVTLSGGALTDRTINFTATANSSVTANYADRAGVKMYFAKPTNLGWSKVYAYAWGPSSHNEDYPGVELENTEVINCVTYYTYQYYTESDGIGGAATGDATWNQIVFGDNNDDRKTGDLTISNGHYYYRNSSGTGKAAAITSAWYIKGTMNSWGETDPITHNCATNSGSVDISLTTGTTWEFKVYNEVNDQMWSNSTACGQGDGITATMASAETLYNNDANVMKITPALNGTYTFTVGSTNASNPTIKVAFPEIYAIAGSFNSWSTEANPLSMDGNTGTADIVLAPSGSNYTLKVVDDGAMYGKNSTTITGTTTVSGLVVGQSDIALTADIYPASANPSYSFSYNKSTKALTVTYPAAHTVTYGVGTHAGTTSVTSSISVASGKKILDSQSITFSKGDTKTGYTWKGWYNNTSGSSSALGTGATYTSSSRAANTSVYACYDLVNYTITYNLNGGSNPVSPAPATSFTIESAAITLPTPSKTGYTFAGWYENPDLSTGGVKTTIPAGSTGNKTYWAKWTPITYTIHFNGNGNTSGSMSNQTGVTYDAATNITTNAFVKTGYNFAGWALSSDGSVVRADGADHGNLTSTNGATVQLWAVWTPKTCTVTFDYQSGAEGYGGDGTLSNVTATYDAAMPALSGNMPTADNGYAFMGFFSETGGNGTKYYNADKSSAHNWDVNTTSTTTLYAYYKKAEITGITFTGGNIVSPSTSTSVTAVIEPTPVAPTTVCWRVLYNNDNPLSPQPTFTPASGASVSFTSPEASGTYKLEAVLHTGSGCGGTELSTYVATFQVAGDHTVTIQYKDGSGNTIKASESMTANPLEYSDAFTAPDIFGYTFSHWNAYDGVKIKDKESEDLYDSREPTIQIKATYDGRLVAEYTQNAIIYFKNTLGWSDVYVNFYTASDWDSSDNGSGSQKGAGNKNVTNRNKHMTRIGDSDVWYYDYGYNEGGSSISPTLYVSFTSASQDNVDEFWASNPGIGVVYPANYADAISTDKSSENGFKAATPMFVPLNIDPVAINVGGGGRANYNNAGYWTKYTPGTGYTLEIYNSAGNSLLKSVEFTSEDELMPMKATVDLEGGTTYKFQLKRSGDIYYGNSGTMTYANHGQNPAWAMTNSPSFSMCGITTNAAGDYTFNLSYSAYSNEYRLRMEVDYPIASGDYRVVYKDNVCTQSKASAIVTKENNGKDTVSFFIRPGQTPVMKIQQATVNGSTGDITWSSGTDVSSSLSALSEDSVYNICLTMNESGAISVEKVEVYTGNYYIRTDAANSKWDNYRSDPDHLMTYSEYSINHGGYSHYYCHWVNKDDAGRKNVKFCIANDYSPSISDTLIRETASGTWANINNYIESNGDLKRNANVRFMWNRHDNTISRAYVDGAQDDLHAFLELISSDSKIRNAETEVIMSEVTFTDKENWLYEADIQAQPNAQIKLKSTWGESNVIEQYFKGSSTTTEALIGGSGENWYDIRILYDFKTNRLVASYVPSEGEISGTIEINADIMFIREHQGDIAQLTFSNTGSIAAIKTAYGALRLNKWVLNNKERTGAHNPLEEPKSIYERSLYWISFPFRVKLSEVFGFGTYGSHWAIQYYDGADRAARGHFLENGTFWKWLNRSTAYLEPNQGYLLAIDLDLLGETSDVWGPESRSEQIELYFPSTGTMPNLTSADVVQTIPEHTCSINRAASEGLPDTGDPRTSYNRTIFDSHWNVLSVPTYVNTDDVTFANTDWTTEGPGKRGPNFLYTWNSDDNTITATAARGYTYHAMHSYMVQYYDEVTWSASSGSPYPIVARKTYEEAPREIEFRLEIQQNEKMIDRTYVVLSNDEEVSANFAFGEDMVKEFNARKAAIFNYTADNVGVAGNTMPMSEQTTVIPVGLEIPTAGEYTFAIPDGTEGVGVILVDNVANTRTNLSALDYTVNLTTGTHDGRFVLEISPIHNATTGIEAVRDEGLEITGARKMIIDQKLYIVKDGKLFDATGKRVE